VEPVIVDATGVVTTPVAITFDNLTSPGTTTASATTTPFSALTEGFKLSPATFYDISTTADYPKDGTARIDVCVDYDPGAFQSPSDVRLLHGERDPVTGVMQWVDRTTRVDATARTVCATVSSLSPFAVAQRNRPPTARMTTSVAALDEGGSVTFDASTSSDADGTVASYAWSFDGGATFTAPSSGPTVSHVFPQDGPQTVVVRVADDRGATAMAAVPVSVANVLPTVSVGGPVDPVALASGAARATIAVSYTDPGTLDPHTVSVACGDGRGATGSPLACTYTTAGVYEVTATVSDDDGQRSAAFDYVVVYDPNGAFVTGGGWIDSPAGACTWSGCALGGGTAGRASFGFVAKYQKGATIPSGETEFQLKAGNLAFTSTSYQWLVVASARAQFKGEGTINGQGRYGFLLTAVDGQISGGGGIDKFRIKIWDKNDGDRVVYDNQTGGSDDADPTAALGSGSIVIHTK
jgi:PKD repeat protein